MRRIVSVLLSVLLILPLFSLTAAHAEAPANTDFLLLINKDNRIDASYKAADMVDLPGTSIKLRAEAAAQYNDMMSAMKAEGIRPPMAVSGYRSYDRQSYLFTSRTASRQAKGMDYDAALEATGRYTAPPGASEHQAGLAVDVSTTGSLSDSFQNTSQGKWLRENSWRFGFILRYQHEKRDITGIYYEPWHFRYVGTPHAQIMFEKKLCLEEYIQALQTDGMIILEMPDGYCYTVFRTKQANVRVDGEISRSADNTGGFIITAKSLTDPLTKVKGHWSAPYFQRLTETKSFVPTQSISPNAPITREGVAQLCQVLPGKENLTGREYLDVKPDDEFYAVVWHLTETGVRLSESSKFYPGRYLSREEAAYAFSGAFDDMRTKALPYTDVGAISKWALKSVQRVDYQGIMTGVDKKFRPKEYLTWGEAAAAVCKLLDIL